MNTWSMYELVLVPVLDYSCSNVTVCRCHNRIHHHTLLCHGPASARRREHVSPELVTDSPRSPHPAHPSSQQAGEACDCLE
jgi:hypothetical protein